MTIKKLIQALKQNRENTEVLCLSLRTESSTIFEMILKTIVYKWSTVLPLELKAEMHKVSDIIATSGKTSIPISISPLNICR